MKRSTQIVLVLVAGVVGLAVWQSMKPKPPTKIVTAKVERVPKLKSVVSATGEIRAKEFVNIQAEVAGLITELFVQEGQVVKRGEPLLRLDDRQLKADEDSARAQAGATEADARNTEVGVATAEASLAAEHTALANAKLEAEQARTTAERSAASFARKKELHDQNLIGSEEFEVAAADARLTRQRLEWNEARIKQAEANLHTATTRVEAAKALRDASCQRLEAAKATLVRASDMRGKTSLLSPLDGIVTQLNVERGERAVPGIQSNPVATLMTIADLSVIEVEARVAEADIVEVKGPASVEVEVDAMRGHKFAGVVAQVGLSPIQAGTQSGGANNQDGKEFKVVVLVTNPAPELRPGFTAVAKITTATRENVLVVPFQAQTAREVEVDAQGVYVAPPMPKDGEEEQKGPLTAAERANRKELKGVFVRRDGRAHFVPATFGVIGDTMDVEVLSGLQEGDEVISGPFQALRTLKVWDRVELDEKRMAAGQNR